MHLRGQLAQRHQEPHRRARMNEAIYQAMVGYLLTRGKEHRLRHPRSAARSTTFNYLAQGAQAA
jgi:hypothetical protein